MTWADLRGVLEEGGLVSAHDERSRGTDAQVVTGIAYDSRGVERGHVFVALKGEHSDGVAFARQAIERGAVAVVSEQQVPGGFTAP